MTKEEAEEVLTFFHHPEAATVIRILEERLIQEEANQLARGRQNTLADFHYFAGVICGLRRGSPKKLIKEAQQVIHGAMN